MSDERLPTPNTLVPTDNRGLAAPARGLVRRGLHMLLREQVQKDTLWEKYNNAGIEAFEQGRYAEAETSFLATLREAERFGSQDLRLAKSLHNLANAYYKQGKCSEAEPLYERALAIAEQVIGIEHPDMATFLSNLAWVYAAQHRSTEAEPLFKSALAIRERVLGPDHPDVARNLVGIATSYEDQFKFAEAEPLYRRALAILEKKLGPADPTCEQLQAHVSGVVRMLEMLQHPDDPAHMGL